MCDYNFSLENYSISVECDYVEIAEETVLYKTEMMYSNFIVSTILCTFVAISGVVSNAINMAVFTKIGFKDSINMSLFALAISDLGSCLFLFPCVLSSFPWNDEFGLPVTWIHVGHITGAWPHVACTKITTLITAFITVERCLCVFVPLKVKTIITRKRTLGFLIFSFLFLGALMAPMFYSNQLGWRFVIGYNRSVFGLIFPKERENIEKVILPIMNAFISIFAFIFIIIATVVLVVTLNKQSRWRRKNTTVTTTPKAGEAGNNDNCISSKEKSISKMVVIISTLFIASLFPSMVMILLLWIDRRFDIGGSLNNLFIIMVNITYTLEGINAALNIFIYYKNSSNYKTMFDQIFGWNKTKIVA